MSQIINKSAISVLDEFCKRKRQPPAVYTFNSDDGASEPFVCTVKAFNETKTGKGKTIDDFMLVVASSLQSIFS